MTRLQAGFTGGFVATVVLSAAMMAKGMMGLMPGLDVIAMLSGMMHGPAALGWMAHFLIGTVAWGGAFALFHDRLPGGTDIAKGIALAVAAWLMMMILVMPMAGAGLFGLGMGPMAPIMTLVLHVLFGAVLGATVHAVSAHEAPAH